MSKIVREEDDVSLFPRFENLVIANRRLEQTLVRYLGQDKNNVFLMILGRVENDVLTLNRGPETMQYRNSVPVAEMKNLVSRELVWRVKERGIPSQMKDYSFGPGEEEKLESRREVVEYIIRVYGNSPLFDRSVYSTSISDASKKFGLAKRTVRKYYERYLFYGGHEFALVDQDWDKGGRGTERRGAKRADGSPIESGRRTFAQTINPQSKIQRVQLSPKLKARLETFVRREAHVPGAKLTDIVRRFRASIRGYNVDADGVKQSFPVDPSKLPSESNLLKVARPIFKAEKARLAVLRNSGKGRGYSAQIARGDLNVVDIDGTTADCFLRYGDSTISMNGVLKPTVLLAIDRETRAIVGWCVTYRPEDANSFLACLYSVCSDKEEELARWKVSHLDGMVFGCPSAIFVDRGSGISEKMQRAAVRCMRQRLLMAAPGQGKAKGDVEQLMGLFQSKISHLPGVSHGEPVKGKASEKDAIRKRNRQKLKSAPGTATLTLEQFMRALLTAISEHNLTADMRRMRNSVMLEANVPPVPKHMFLFNTAMKEGDAAWELTEEAVIRSLSSPFKTTAPGGVIKLEKTAYSSTELRERAIAYEAANNGKSLPVEGYELFTSKLHAVWDDNGHFVELEATLATLAKFGITLPTIRDYIQFRDGGDWAEEVYKNRDHPTVEQAAKGGVSQATQKRMERVDGVRRTVNDRRTQKVAEAHAGAAHTRAVLASARGNVDAISSSQKLEPASEAYLLDDAQEIDIDF